MENRKEPLVITALVAGMLWLGAAQPSAERDSNSKPTVAVVSFTGVPAEQGDAMADRLASELVDTGRFRVMPRDWLGTPPRPEMQSLAVVREAAAAAGVKFLLLGDARPARVLGAPSHEVLLIDVRVVEVATGEVIRTARARSSGPGRVRPPMPRAPMTMGPMTRPGRGPSSTFFHLAASAVAVRSAMRPPNPTASKYRWEQAIADIARSITVPGESR